MAELGYAKISPLWNSDEYWVQGYDHYSVRTCFDKKEAALLSREEFDRLHKQYGGIGVWQFIVPGTLMDAMLARPVEPAPVPMLLTCPSCGERHIDEGEWAEKPHHTHACQHCGHVWRPAVINTVGVRFLPGFKNEVV